MSFFTNSHTQISLSPACILSFLITAVTRGEFKDAWDWSDAPEPKEEEHVGAKEDGESKGEMEVDAPNGEVQVQQLEDDGFTEKAASTLVNPTSDTEQQDGEKSSKKKPKKKKA